jgi:hypothetical protein
VEIGLCPHSRIYPRTVQTTSGDLVVSHTPNQTSHMQLAWFPGSCKSHISLNGKLQSVSFDMYRAPSPLGFIMQ